MYVITLNINFWLIFILITKTNFDPRRLHVGNLDARSEAIQRCQEQRCDRETRKR